jgi:MFS family permease
MGHYGAMHDEKSIPGYSAENLFTRDFILAFCAFFCFASAFHALTPTLPIFLAGLGSAKQDIGILVGTIGISSLVFRFVAGNILMKYSERLLLLTGTIVFALSFPAFIIFRPFWPLFAVRLLQGIAFACMDTAIISYIIRTMPLQLRTRVINYFMLAPPLASGVATAASVFILNKWGFNAVLFTGTGLGACAFFLMWKLKGQKRPLNVPDSPVHEKRYFERRIFAPALLIFLCVCALGGITAFFPLFAIGCGVKNPGLFYSATAVMLVLSRLTVGRIFSLYEKEKIIVGSIFIMIISLITLALSSTLPMFILAGFLWGIGFGVLFPLTMAYSLEYAGSSDGVAVATYQAFVDLGIAAGPAIAGIMLPFTGYKVMFLCQGLFCFVGLMYFQFYLRNRHSRAAKV